MSLKTNDMDRSTGKINAGSMADIAFLLLIFFLVTTTMEVDAGIHRNLPVKLNNPPPTPPVPERDVLNIQVNKDDELFVEDQVIAMNELEDVCRSFYIANSNGAETDASMPEYSLVTESDCIQEIIPLQSAVDENQNDKYANKELQKWQRRLTICALEGGSYYEISKRAIVRLKNQASTTYGTYIAIQNSLKKVVNELRQERCDRYGWGNYFEINEDTQKGKEKIQMLRLLVPERIIEAKIER